MEHAARRHAEESIDLFAMVESASPSYASIGMVDDGAKWKSSTLPMTMTHSGPRAEVSAGRVAGGKTAEGEHVSTEEEEASRGNKTTRKQNRWRPDQKYLRAWRGNRFFNTITIVFDFERGFQGVLLT